MLGQANFYLPSPELTSCMLSLTTASSSFSLTAPLMRVSSWTDLRVMLVSLPFVKFTMNDLYTMQFTVWGNSCWLMELGKL